MNECNVLLSQHFPGVSSFTLCQKYHLNGHFPGVCSFMTFCWSWTPSEPQTSPGKCPVAGHFSRVSSFTLCQKQHFNGHFTTREGYSILNTVTINNIPLKISNYCGRLTCVTYPSSPPRWATTHTRCCTVSSYTRWCTHSWSVHIKLLEKFAVKCVHASLQKLHMCLY